jgi:hypothetical protein
MLLNHKDFFPPWPARFRACAKPLPATAAKLPQCGWMHPPMLGGFVEKSSKSQDF